MSRGINLIFIVFCADFVSPVINRDPNFPPKMMKVYYTTFIPRCERETSVNRSVIDAFNDAEDFAHLPADRPLKCYMLCQLEAMDMIHTDVAKIDALGVFDNLEPLKSEHQDIFIRMGLKCLKSKVPADGDRCETAYNWNVCLKKGDIHHYLLL